MELVDWSVIWETYAPALRVKRGLTDLGGICILPSGNILAIKKGPKTLSIRLKASSFARLGVREMVYRGPTMLPLSDHPGVFYADFEGNMLVSCPVAEVHEAIPSVSLECTM